MEPRKLYCNEKVWLVGGHPSIQTDGNVARQPEDTWTCDHQDRHLTQKVPAAGPVNLFWMHQQMFDSFKPYTGFLYVTGVITFSLLENFPISISLNKTLLAFPAFDHVTWMWVWISLMVKEIMTLTRPLLSSLVHPFEESVHPNMYLSLNGSV